MQTLKNKYPDFLTIVEKPDSKLKGDSELVQNSFILSNYVKEKRKAAIIKGKLFKWRKFYPNWDEVSK